MRRLLLSGALASALLTTAVAEAPARTTDRHCGGNPQGLRVYAYGHVSCPFAINTANAVLGRARSSGGYLPRNFDVRPFSPVTHKRYRVHCHVYSFRNPLSIECQLYRGAGINLYRG